MTANKTPVSLAAFAIALVLAPLFVAALGFWAIIPVFAPIYGLPTYLTFGAVGFYLSLRAGLNSRGDLAAAGLGAHVLSLPIVYLVMLLWNMDVELFTILACFGAVMAPLWGLMFGVVYRGLCDE